MRAPRGRFQSIADGVDRQRTGGARRVANASPVSAHASAVAEAVGSAAGATFGESMIDPFTLASSGAQDLTLTYLPKFDSWNVSLNGFAALDGTDYTISGQTLSLLTPLDARTGDVVQVQYDYLTGQAQPSREESPDADLYLPLGEASGSVAGDYSGNGHDGTYYGTPGYHATSLRADGGGYAVTFSGDDYVDVNWDTWMESTSITVECFLKTTTTSYLAVVSREMIGSGWRVWVLRTTNTGKIQLEVLHPGIADFTSTTTINDGVKHHVAAVVDGATVKMYVDGVLDTSTAYTTPLVTTEPARLSVGCTRGSSGDTPSGLFVGTIDEVGYYTRALTAGEIATLAAR